MTEDILRSLRGEFEDLFNSAGGSALEDDDQVQWWLTIAEIKALLNLIKQKEAEKT